ncbi:hypothetical protein [Streptomyces sp. NPDC018833]|uniref:hypothetical protein n=1 Tax=Streptomyces sp. NPDC018833 TaxID=3365053 RepID=UPI0037B49747
MTHSGQGDEQRLPAARPAHEGVVLPADGSEPLIPGAPDAQATPAGGQPWGAPWGPPQHQAPGSPGSPGLPPTGHGHPVPGAPEGHGYPAAQAGPAGPGTAGSQAGLPTNGYGAPGAPAPQGPTGYGTPPNGPGAAGASAPQPGYGYPGAQDGPAGYGYPAAAQGQTAYGTAPNGPGGPGSPQPGYGYPGAPAGFPPAPQAGHPGAPAQAQPGYGYPGATGEGQPGGYGAPASQGQTNGYGAPAPQGGAPVPAAQHGVTAQPLPPHDGPGQAEGGAADDRTQMLPPQGGTGVTGASDATQYIAPVTGAAATPPGALPPEMPAESTTFLGTGRAAEGDSDATQYIAPVPQAPAGAPFGVRPGAPGDRQPPAEFDSLFRSDAPQAQPADPTQQLPRFDARQGAQPSAYREPEYPSRYDDDEPASRRRSIVPVVAALVIGCAVLGLGVGAVMSGGEEDKDPAPDANVAATSLAPSASASTQAADPAEPQAKELDKLLADSNNSRAAVIRSVENIKVCKNLDQAVTDLKGAAAQRRSLVTRLDGLAVDKLPDNAALTAALTKAWQASASADDHYAAWAQQVKGKKGCKDGKARVTSHTAEGNRASGEATKAKNEAAPLWNVIARKHGLTERRSNQL